MTSGEHKIVQYLNEAHAMEEGLTRVLQAQIAAAPRGDFRRGLERHLTETQRHAERVRRRLSELDGGSNPVELGIGLIEAVVGQALALAKTPIDLIRGRSGDEKMLKDAKDACATESLEIATYTALERLAQSVGDTRTAELAGSICADEQRMLDRLLGELPQLALRVADSEVRGEPSYEISKTGAADAARDAGHSAKRSAGQAKRTASRAGSSVKRTARKASGSTPSRRSTSSRRGSTSGGSRRAAGRSASSRAAKAGTRSRAPEPWPGYDEQTVDEVRAALDDAGSQRARRVRTYEQAHKDRTGVVEKAEREVAQS